jgi:hypothetical protein
MTLIAKNEVGNLSDATAVYKCRSHLPFVILSTYRCKYKLAAALFGRPRQEALMNREQDMCQRKREFVEGAPKLRTTISWIPCHGSEWCSGLQPVCEGTNEEDIEHYRSIQVKMSN